MRDGEVGAAIAVGDPGGLAEAYDRYASALYTYCRSLVREPGEAADAVQDTFVIAAAELAGLQDRQRLRPWLYAVARNECLRRTGGAEAFAGPLDAVPVPPGGAAGGAMAGGAAAGGATAGGAVGGATAGGVADGVAGVTGVTGDVFGAAERAELGALLRGAACGLGTGERDLIQLRWQQGLDVAEIAAIIGVSRNRAHALLSRAQDQLVTALGALLVARTGVDDCATLSTLLGDGDGQLTVTMRKRIDRHILRCRVCAERRYRELGPRLLLGLTPLAALPVAAMPADLRARVLTLANSGTPGAVAYRASVTGRSAPFRRHGFPKPIDPPGREWRPTRQRQAAAAAGVAIAGAVAAATLLTLALAGGGPGSHEGAAPAGRPGPASLAADPGGRTGAGTGPAVPGSARPSRTGRASPSVTVTVTVGRVPPTVGSATGGPAARGSRPSATGSASRRASPAPSGRSATPRATGTATPRPAQGTLTVLPKSITALPGRSVTLILTASNGPVSWSITLSTDLIGELSVVPSSGTLAAGASATVTVTPGDLLMAGGQLTLDPGGIVVTVMPYM